MKYQELLDEFCKRMAHSMETAWMDTTENKFELRILDLEWAMQSILEKLRESENAVDSR